MQASISKIHYGWVIVLSGFLTLMACLGLGRFAIGMLLPSMGETLNLSYSEMGFIGTGNFLGYLIAVVVVHRLVERIGERKTISLSLALIAFSLFLLSLGQSFVSILLLYFITGIASGGANVPMMGLVSHWFWRDLRGKAAGFIVVGNGLGMMLTGLMVPAFNLRLGAEGWRMSWVVISLLVLVISVVGYLLLRNRPEDMGLKPLGRRIERGSGTETDDRNERRKTVFHLGAIYFMFGFSYVIYATFIVTSLVNEHGFSENAAGNVWFWIGMISLLSGPLFGSLSDRLGRRNTLMMVYLLQVSAYLLIALINAPWAIYLSIFLFGICVWSVPSIMAAATGDYMGSQHAVAAFGLITLFFGLGQIVGPGLAGVIAEFSGSFVSSYLMAAAASISAVFLLLALRKPR